jgi:excisionase family DNA binding protein
MSVRRAESSVVLLTPRQAADALGNGRWKVYDLLRQGRLRSLRIGSCRRISTTALTRSPRCAADRRRVPRLLVGR